jgi:hypothetical protein
MCQKFPKTRGKAAAQPRRRRRGTEKWQGNQAASRASPSSAAALTARSPAPSTSSKTPPPVCVYSPKLCLLYARLLLIGVMQFDLPVRARVHRGEGKGHGPCAGPPRLPHPRLRRHHQRLQLHWSVAFSA